MEYTMTKPCADCPFINANKHAYSIERLAQFTSTEFPCHKTADLLDDEDGGSGFVATPESQHCAGALIFLEKRGKSHQMMRIVERFGSYDHTKLDMTADVR